MPLSVWSPASRIVLLGWGVGWSRGRRRMRESRGLEADIAI